MPIYDYQCEKCGLMEIAHSMTSLVPDICPTCGEPITRVFLAPGVVFKGSGWAKDGYQTNVNREDK